MDSRQEPGCSRRSGRAMQQEPAGTPAFLVSDAAAGRWLRDPLLPRPLQAACGLGDPHPRSPMLPCSRRLRHLRRLGLGAAHQRQLKLQGHGLLPRNTGTSTLQGDILSTSCLFSECEGPQNPNMFCQPHSLSHTFSSDRILPLPTTLMAHMPSLSLLDLESPNPFSLWAGRFDPC